jgi:hypothetical protein
MFMKDFVLRFWVLPEAQAALWSCAEASANAGFSACSAILELTVGLNLRSRIDAPQNSRNRSADRF